MLTRKWWSRKERNRGTKRTCPYGGGEEGRREGGRNVWKKSVDGGKEGVERTVDMTMDNAMVCM